jgi:enoyl-CoA hydratase/carnithine racemase
MPTLTHTGRVWLLDLGEGENRFSPGWVDDVSRLLDKAQTQQPGSGLVTAARGRFWSNGLDVEWIAAHPDRLGGYFDAVHTLLGRVLTFPAPTAAAVQGHAFGAGAMLALAHDWRVMRADRGYLCLPEVDLGLSFTPGMLALMQAKLTPGQATDLLVIGRRFGGHDAQSAGLIALTADEGAVEERATALVEPWSGKPATAVGQVKRDMYAHALNLLESSSEPANAA